MLKLSCLKYVAFTLSIFLAATGLSVEYIGCNYVLLLSYIYEWLPNFMWTGAFIELICGICICALGISFAIATVTQNWHSFRNLLLILLGLVILQIIGAILFYVYESMMLYSLALHMKSTMVISMENYGLNTSDTELWDEIQMEVNCCGVYSYTDWFNTSYGDGKNVPDSCCLLFSVGCGVNISDLNDPSDQIITYGCLPILFDSISHFLDSTEKLFWIPLCIVHAFLLIIFGIMYTYRVVSTSPSVKPKSSETKYFMLHNHH